MKISLILISFVSLIFLNTGLSFAQEQKVPTPAPTEEIIQGPPATENPAEAEIEWTLGTVVSVDSQNKTLLVKYLDYETDTEKEMDITVNDKTVFENCKSLEEIKPQDTVSIDYLASPDGKNIAKNVSLEKPEETEAPQQQQATEEVTPEDLQPTPTPEE